MSGLGCSDVIGGGGGGSRASTVLPRKRPGWSGWVSGRVNSGLKAAANSFAHGHVRCRCSLARRLENAKRPATRSSMIIMPCLLMSCTGLEGRVAMYVLKGTGCGN
jgi:hypothetical protein